MTLRYDMKWKAILPHSPYHPRNPFCEGSIVDHSYAEEELRVTEAFQQIQVWTQQQLVSALSIQFNDECLYKIPTGKYGPRDVSSLETVSMCNK